MLIIRESRGNTLNPTIHDRRIDGKVLRIGRGSDQDVLVKDPRVSWEHARLIEAESGKVMLEVLPDASSVLLDGAPARGGKLKDGSEIILGGQRLLLHMLEDRCYIEISEAPRGKDQAQEEARAAARLSLAEAAVSKRRWSWSLLSLVLLLGLLLPLGARWLPGAYEPLKAVPFLPLDEVWNSGPISAAHQSFATQCDSCHLQLFEQVPDRACAVCHADTQHHDDDLALLQSSGIDAYSCTSCHREHDGDDGLILAHPRLCTDCHADPGGRMPGSELLAAADFAGAHPQFSPLIWTLDDGGQRVEASTPWTAGQRESSSLIYPHDVHLDPRGVEDRDGNLQVLDCQSCHEYQAGRVSFQPVDFEQHCQSCHSLEFDPLNPGREVPHGNTQAVLDDLRGYYARQVLEGAERQALALPRGPRGRDRSTQVDDAERRTLLGKADGLARDAIDESLRVRLCAKCHTIGPPASGGADWDVVPFVQRPIWMTAARFDHARHTSTSCESCHNARSSDTADDVLLPGMDNCSSCHGGNRTQPGKIRSLCVDCHGFHLADHARMLSAADLAHAANSGRMKLGQKLPENGSAPLTDDAEP